MAHGKSQPKTASVGQIQSSNRHEGAIMKSKDEKHQVFMQAGRQASLLTLASALEQADRAWTCQRHAPSSTSSL